MQERPHFRRSALWQRERDITAWVQEGYSFRQIATELSRQGTQVSGRWLQEWYAKNVGRRRIRAQARSGKNTDPPTGSPAPPLGEPSPRPPGKATPPKHPSPAPAVSAAAGPADVTALFQSQFKRPRK